MSPEQQELSDAVGQFAARHAPIATTRDSFDDLAAGRVPGWWDALVANGFHAVHLPEDLGGQGGRPIDAACVLEAAGKSLLPGPLLSTVAARPFGARARRVGRRPTSTSSVPWRTDQAIGTAVRKLRITEGGVPLRQAETTTGMIIGRRRSLPPNQRPTTRRTTCCSW